MKKFTALLIILSLLIIPQTGCASKSNNQGIEKTSFHLDTICRITIYSMDGMEEKSEEEQRQDALITITDAFKICDSYEKILSKTIEESDVYKINHAGGQAVTVRDETIEVIEKGIEFGEKSEGAFDITIGAVSDIWDFHGQDDEGEHTGKVPEDYLLREAVSHVDYRGIIIEGNTVRMADPEAQLDLGGIAKGYIADKVARYLEEQGVTSAIVDLGGNIVAIGEKGQSMTESRGELFKIGIKDPSSESGQLLGILPCRDKTVVTSGTYERYFEIDGVRYHHVLNPETGYPADTDLLSVTVIADKGDSAYCDGLSTSCLALGYRKAAELIKDTDGVEAIFVTKDGEIHLSADDTGFELS